MTQGSDKQNCIDTVIIILEEKQVKSIKALQISVQRVTLYVRLNSVLEQVFL